MASQNQGDEEVDGLVTLPAEDRDNTDYSSLVSG